MSWTRTDEQTFPVINEAPRRDGALLMYRDCPFCGRTHQSAYVDELEATVMACRDNTMPDRRGSLEAWGAQDTVPVRPEVEAYAAGCP